MDSERVRLRQAPTAETLLQDLLPVVKTSFWRTRTPWNPHAVDYLFMGWQTSWCEALYVKWGPCLCARGLSASITNLHSALWTFSTVCSSSSQNFQLLGKTKFQHFFRIIHFASLLGRYGNKASFNGRMLYNLCFIPTILGINFSSMCLSSHQLPFSSVTFL